MQGMQVFTGTHDAWGGFASRYLERVRDEYGKVPVWVWGVEDIEQKEAVRIKLSYGTSGSLNSIDQIISSKKGSFKPPIQLDHSMIFQHKPLFSFRSLFQQDFPTTSVSGEVLHGTFLLSSLLQSRLLPLLRNYVETMDASHITSVT